MNRGISVIQIIIKRLLLILEIYKNNLTIKFNYYIRLNNIYLNKYYNYKYINNIQYH